MGIVNVADIVATEVADGVIRSTLGDSTDGSGFDRDVAQWGTEGFVSRPNDPDANGAAQALYVWDGQEKRILGTRDYRHADKAADLEPGDRAVVSDCDARFVLKRGENALVLSAGDTTIQIKPGEIQIAVEGGGAITIDAQGVHVHGPKFAANTTTGNLGTIAGAPPPQPANSIIFGTSGQTGAPSATWTVAP